MLAAGLSDWCMLAPGMSKIEINRAPVLTLWGFVVAQRLGHSRETSLSLAKPEIR